MEGSGKVRGVQGRGNVHDAVSFFHDNDPSLLHPKGDAGTANVFYAYTPPRGFHTGTIDDSIL